MILNHMKEKDKSMSIKETGRARFDMKSLIITTTFAALLLAVSTKGFACEIAEPGDSDFVGAVESALHDADFGGIADSADSDFGVEGGNDYEYK